jgi:DNA-binding response OmpR family regulator
MWFYWCDLSVLFRCCIFTLLSQNITSFEQLFLDAAEALEEGLPRHRALEALASRRDLSGVARILIASLKSDDIAYLLLESGGMDRFVKTIIYREVRLDVNAILERFRVLGLYRYVGEGLQPVWPFQLYRGLLDSSTVLWTLRVKRLAVI